MKHSININSLFVVPADRSNVCPGELLVAEPFMSDKWFGRSVVVIVDNSDAEGTTGLTLNLETTTKLHKVLPAVERDNVPLFCGGPVGHDQLMFLHTLGESIIPGAKEICSGLWLGGNFDSMVEYVNSGYPIDGHIRFFVGYSGWSPGQLSDEIKANAWGVFPVATAQSWMLSESGAKAWKRVVTMMDARYHPWLMVPADTRAN